MWAFGCKLCKISRAVLSATVAGATVALVAWVAVDAQERDRAAGAPGASRKGFGPPAGPGSGGPMGPGGPGFGPGTFLAPQALAAADADGDGRLTPGEAAEAARRFVRDADTDKKGSIEEQVLGRAINRRIERPPGFGPGGPPGGPDGPPAEDFGPGTFLAPRIVELADANQDGRLSPDEAARFAERFVREADRSQKGSIDAGALGQAINRQMGPPPGFGPGGPMGGERKLVKDFDQDGDGRLNRQERRAARASLKAEREKSPRGGPRRRGFGPPPGFGGAEEPAKPGPRVSPSDVATFPGKGLYDPDVLRTLFLRFEDEDWEAALEDFHGTDVEVPADLTVDGRTYPGVGVHFRGLSSYMGVRAGHKRSLNVSLDFVDADQRLDGYKTLNLLNAHEDPSFLHTVLYSHIARNSIPAPKANLVRVAINGESWGVYVNAQQFDKIFQAESGVTGKAARWKVRGNPGADGGLTYVGEDLEEYKKRYEMKAGGASDWKALIHLCKLLEQTPPDRLEAALRPVLDVDGVLWFLALDNALINNDGYWTRASDYSLYRDAAGRFHVAPHDMNEAFGPAMGFGFGPPGRAAADRPSGVDLDPLIGLENPRTPLRGRLLAVPSLRARYLDHVRTIAREWLDWTKLGPVVAHYRSLIEKAVEEDTRKLSSIAAFRAAVADSPGSASQPRGRPIMGLRAFADRRRQYLMDYVDRTGGGQ